MLAIIRSMPFNIRKQAGSKPKGKMARRLTVIDKTRIIQARMLGYSERAIAAETGHARETVRAVLRDNPVSVELLTEKAVELAQEAFNNALQPEALAAIAVQQKRQLLTLFSEVRDATEAASLCTDVDQSALLARRAAALSTALTNLHKAHLLSFPTTDQQSGELPELVVKVMDEEDVRQMRAQQEAELELIHGSEIIEYA